MPTTMLLSGVLSPWTPPSNIQDVLDNIAKTLIDLEASYITNAEAAILDTIISGQSSASNSLVGRIESLGDIQQLAALAQPGIRTAARVNTRACISPNTFYLLYRRLLIALDTALGGLNDYLTANGIQVHSELANAFNFIAENAVSLALTYRNPDQIVSSNIFIASPVTLGTVVAQSTTFGIPAIMPAPFPVVNVQDTGVFVHVSDIDTLHYGAAPLYVVVTPSMGVHTDAVSLTVHYVDGSLNANTTPFSHTVVAGTYALGVTGVSVSNIEVNSGAVSGDLYAVIASSSRSVSY